MLALAVLSSAGEEKKAVEDSKAEETQAEQPAEKKQDKRGIHDFGDWSSHGSSHHDHGHHEEKTLTIVKKVPVPVPHYKTVHVPQIKEVHVPYHVKVPKPYPVVKHVSWKSNPRETPPVFLTQHFLIVQVPYTVKEIVKVPVHVDKPYPVEKVSAT